MKIQICNQSFNYTNHDKIVNTSKIWGNNNFLDRNNFLGQILGLRDRKIKKISAVCKTKELYPIGSKFFSGIF